MKVLSIFGFTAALLVLLLSAGPALSLTGEDQAENPWNGTWKSELYRVLIIQNGTAIAGSYEPDDIDAGDPGLLKGTLSEDGMTFSGIWTESGPLTFIISEDGMSYTGIGNVRSEGAIRESEEYTTAARRVGGITDPDNIWTGTWNSTRTLLTLAQNGTVISGLNKPLPGIEDEPGLFEGTVSEDGKTVDGKWVEAGVFSFTLSDEGPFFNGTYTTGLEEGAESDFWNATKID